MSAPTLETGPELGLIQPGDSNLVNVTEALPGNVISGSEGSPGVGNSTYEGPYEEGVEQVDPSNVITDESTVTPAWELNSATTVSSTEDSTPSVTMPYPAGEGVSSENGGSSEFDVLPRDGQPWDIHDAKLPGPSSTTTEPDSLVTSENGGLSGADALPMEGEPWYLDNSGTNDSELTDTSALTGEEGASPEDSSGLNDGTEQETPTGETSGSLSSSEVSTNDNDGEQAEAEVDNDTVTSVPASPEKADRKGDKLTRLAAPILAAGLLLSALLPGDSGLPNNDPGGKQPVPAEAKPAKDFEELSKPGPLDNLTPEELAAFERMVEQGKENTREISEANPGLTPEQVKKASDDKLELDMAAAAALVNGTNTTT